MGHMPGYSTTSSSSKSRKHSEVFEKFVSDDKLSCNDVVSSIGTNYSTSVLSLGSECGGLGRGVENLVIEDNQREKLGNIGENEKLDNAQFVFGSRRVIPEFNRGVEKREDGLHGKNTSSESGVKWNLDAKVEFGKVDRLSFVLSAGGTKWQPHSRKEKAVSENSVGKLPLNDENSRSISSRDQEGDNINIGVEYELGKIKAFLRASQIGVLDARRAKVLGNAAKHVQGRLRTYIARKDFLSTRATTISVQAYCQGIFCDFGTTEKTYVPRIGSKHYFSIDWGDGWFTYESISFRVLVYFADYS
ncbi:hypothetical protein Ancab_032852 [Ancistrocladus abbreviatus]